MIATALLALTLQTQSHPTGLVVPEGLELELWAESPQLFNPTAMDVDARGRIFVTEAVNYRKWRGRNPGLVHEGGDRVVILEDLDGDGRCDRSTVFCQDPELVAPLGISVIGDEVFVACSPSILVFRDTDGDDVADEKRVFLTGFGGHDHDHGVHSFTPGPDGRLYGNAGNAGPHLVTDRSGFRLRSGSLYVGGGQFTADNKPGLVSDDGRAWTGGLMLRVDPDGSGLEVLAHNFRNPYEVACDSFGDLFTADNDDDGNAGCRTTWVMEGGNYGFFSADGTRTWQADRRPGQDTQRAHWHQDDPGVAPAGTINGGGGPTGVCVYEGARLARWIDGCVLNADAGRGVVYAHRPRIAGAGIALEKDVLVEALDGDAPERRWFRPSDVVVGTDGCVYVSDWFDPGVGGHGMGDREGYGRILRIAPEGDEPRTPAFDLTSNIARARAFRSPAASVRELARRALRAVPGELGNLAGDSDPRVRARAMLALRGLPQGHVFAQSAAMSPTEDERVRVASLRSLRGTEHCGLEFLSAAARSDSPGVRREVAHELRDRPTEEVGELLIELAQRLDVEDRHALEAFGAAAEGRGEEFAQRLAEAFGATGAPSEWSARFAMLAWRLHDPSYVPALRERALAAELSTAARRQAIDALAFTPTAPAAEAMLDVALRGHESDRGYARFWLEHRSTNDWRAFGVRRQLGPSGFGDAEVVFESDVVRSGSIDVDVDVSGARGLWLVVEDGGNGNSCDWADWIEPRVVTERGELSLTEDLEWTEASAQWGSVNRDRNAGGGELRVAGELVSGIGTHASSRIAWSLPEDARRFACRAGVDDGGTSQGGGQQTSVRFKVLVERAPDQSAAVAASRVLADESASQEARRAAALELASSGEGGHLLLRLAERRELPEDLRALVGERLFSNPDLAVRALAGEYFERPAGDGLPPVREMLALEGDAARGRALFQTERAQCTRCHAFRSGAHARGEAIGPELTEIRAKFGRAELLDAILHPSAAIALGYETWRVVDDAGRIYSGFVIEDGADLVLKDTQGRRHVIPADEVEERVQQKLSTMPEGVATGLSAQELMDVVAFLLDDPAPLSRGREHVLFDGSSLEAWTHHLSDPAASFDDVWSVEGDVLICKGRPAGYLRTVRDFTNFVLEFDWRFDPEQGPGNSGVLLRLVGEDKVWPKSIEAQLHHRNAGDIWNIDAVDLSVDPERTQGRRTKRLAPSSERPLGEWNHYRITLDRGDLTLEVNGVVQNTASWCEELPGKLGLQSEGAEIHFRNIRVVELVR